MKPINTLPQHRFTLTLMSSLLAVSLASCGSGGGTDTESIASASSSAQTSNGTESTLELGAALPDNVQNNAGTNEGGNSAAQPNTFSSASSTGFEASVLEDGTIEVKWAPAADARGYNVYRAGEYITSVSEARYTDSRMPSGSYYYEIVAYDHNDNFVTVAEGLTVKVEPALQLGAALGGSNVGAEAEYEFALTPAHIRDDYELVFRDEFEGNALDTTKWNTSYLWGADLVINGEEQYYVDIKNQPDFGYNPFTVDGETLTIESVRTPESLLEKANGQRYLSGVITSYDSFQFTYGYAEARVKVPFGQGFWSAFWLLNAYYVERKPEIDIMEHIGHDRDVVFHTYHYYDSNGLLHSTQSMETAGVDFTSDFHTFAVEWEPGKITYYVDGEERHSISDPSVSGQSMYLIANTALGGWWPGPPDEWTPFPAQHKIDYIRAWQKRGVQNDQPYDDGIQTIPFADDVPGHSPNHRPSIELWPAGWLDQQ